VLSQVEALWLIAYFSTPLRAPAVGASEDRPIYVDSVVGPRLKIIESILRTASEQGEIDSASITPLSSHVGPALINQHFLLTGRPLSRRELILALDTVIRPREAVSCAD
jgi:hypothetical protein